jgi:DDE superfamily endonuclease
MTLANLQAFRQKAYHCLGQAHDALFELMDAVLLTPKAASLAQLSLSPAFRRQWPSVYAALQDGKPERTRLMQLYLTQMPQESGLVLAGDHTVWPRPYARTLPERTYEHQGGRGLGGKPVTLGQGYSTLAWIPEAEGSWALPLLHERINSAQTPIAKAVQQLEQVCQQLRVRPLSLWDAEYGCAPFVQATAHIAADKLLRLRSNLCLWSAPPPYGGRGRPRTHGNKFKLNDPATWSVPTEQLTLVDPQLGSVQVSRWLAFHFRKAPEQPLSLIRVECSALKSVGQLPRVLWLAWVGLSSPSLREIWRRYLRRFTIDHWYRFAKQRLHWTLPQVVSRERSDCWSDLMPLLTWQLWLARAVVTDKPLPWQKQGLTRLTPGRVAQAMAAIFLQVHTPAQAPKPRGNSPGWPEGLPRIRRPFCPTIKKRFSKPKKPKSRLA